MALPVLADTWRFALNNNITSAASAELQHERVMRILKQALKGEDGGGVAFSWTDSAGAGASAPAALFQTRGSCNGAGTFGNNDNVDRWVADSDVSFGFGANRSWWAGENTALGLHLLLDCRTGNVANPYEFLGSNGANPNTNGIRVSQSGYFAANGGVDGSASLAPTASADIRISEDSASDAYSANAEWLGDSPVSQYKYHVITNVAGTRWRILFYRGGFCAGMLFIDVPLDPVVIPNGAVGVGPTHTWNGDDKPWVGWWIGANTNSAADRATGHDAVFNFARCNTSLANMASNTQNAYQRPGCSQEELGDDNTPISRTGISALSGQRPFAPIGVLSNAAGFEGRCGILTDTYFGNDTDQGVAEGDNYPDDLTRQWTAYGGLILPNNGSVIQTT